MNDSVQVNQAYLIFNRPQFLVDSSDILLLLNNFLLSPFEPTFKQLTD